MRNKSKKLTVIMVTSLFFTGQTIAAEVNMSSEAAYIKASRVLVEIGALPTFRDKELLIIKTDPLPLSNVVEEADCGTMFGIPYTKDKRTKVAATYQVSIKALSEKTAEVNLKISLDGYMDVNEGAPFFIEKTRDNNKVLSCTSTGHLESSFFNKLTVE